MAFDGTEGGKITLEEGAKLTANYRRENPKDRIAHFFGRDILNQLLQIEGAMGIRMYYGVNNEGDKELVLVATDADGNDITELVVDLSTPCPSFCSASNPLNS